MRAAVLCPRAAHRVPRRGEDRESRRIATGAQSAAGEKPAARLASRRAAAPLAPGLGALPSDEAADSAHLTESRLDPRVSGQSSGAKPGTVASMR